MTTWRRRGRWVFLLLLSWVVLPIGGAATEESRPATGGGLEVPSFRLETPGFAGPDPEPAALSLGGTTLSYPDWLKRVDIGIGLGSEKPRYHIETVQPLYQSRDQVYTLFVQPRVSSTDEDWTANLGVGYRQLFLDNQLLGGVNSFYDYADAHNHYRLGVGLELLTRWGELRTNSYLPLSGRRRIVQDANQKVFERAVTGMDVEAGGPVPYLPFLKLFGSYAFYDYRHDIDSHIGKVRGELKLTRFFRLDAEAWNDNKAPWEYRVGLVFTIDFDRPGASFARPSADPYPYKDVRHLTLHRVVRDHEIKVERYAKSRTGGVTVAMRRGT